MKTDKSGKFAVIDHDQFFINMDGCIKKLSCSVLNKDPNPKFIVKPENFSEMVNGLKLLKIK